MMFRPLEKKRYSEQVAELLQAKILREHLKTGTHLPSEKDMAQEFQVSRTVIREALRILEISGLVHIKKGPSGGIFVSDIYHKPMTLSLGNLIISGEITIEHLFNTRLLIEPHIAREAALHATEKHITLLEDLFRDCARHQGDVSLLKNDNLQFHLLLAKACGNPVLATLMEAVLELLTEISSDFLDLSLERHFSKAHHAIFEVIRKRQPDTAEYLIREDILDVKRRLEALKDPSTMP